MGARPCLGRVHVSHTSQVHRGGGCSGHDSRRPGAGAGIGGGSSGVVGRARAGPRRPRRPSRQGAALQREDAHQQGLRRRREQRGPRGLEDRGRGAPQGRQRRGRRRRDRRRPRRHRALQQRHRRRRLLRVLRRPEPPGDDDRRPRDRAPADAKRRVRGPRRPRGGPLLVPGAGDERRVRRGAGHPGHLGAGAEALGLHQPREGAATRHATGPTGLRRRRDLPRADRRQRQALQQLPGHHPVVPARWRAARGRLGHAQPRPRRHLPADRPPGHPGVLRGTDRARDRPGCAEPPEEQRRRPAGAHPAT